MAAGGDVDDSDSRPGSARPRPEPTAPGYLESLVGSVSAVLWEFDWSTGAFTYVSDAAEQILGFTREEWLEPGFWVSRIHPDDAQWAPAFCMLATRDLQDHEFDYRLIHADGHTVWVHEVVTVDRERGLDGLLRGVMVDITAQKEADERHESAERHFHSIMDNVGLLAVELDVDGVITYANPAAERVIGATPGLVGMLLFDVLPPDQRDYARGIFSEHMSSGDEMPAPVELSVLDAEGFRRLLRVNYSSIYDPSGALAGVSAVAEDITETSAYERQIARKAEEFDAIFKLTHDLYLRVDAEGRLTDYRAQEGREAYTPLDALVGRDWTEGLPQGVAAILKQGVASAHADGEMRSAEYELPFADRTEQREARFLPLERGDTAVIIRNITDRKAAERRLRASEERYRAIMESAPFGMRVYQIEGDRMLLKGANRAADLITRMDHRALEGMPLEKAFPLLSELEPYREFRDIALNGGTIGPFEISIPQGDELRTFKMTAFQIQPGQVASVFEDITELKRADARERQYQRRLSRLATDLTDAEDLERRRLAEELHDRVTQTLAVAMLHLRTAESTASGESAEALTLGRQLLEEAIAETRTITTELFPPVLVELGLGPALQWLCEETERLHSLRCIAEISPRLPELSDEESIVLFRGARELLVNVAKHAKATRATITLCGSEKRIELTVDDDGCGFDPESVTGNRSSGFGLFSIRERLPYLGGELIIGSAPGEGTRATMRIRT